ncbi:MAG TPA: hypothetical protein VHB27_02630 [Rhodopila sp.]|uniref:hypothetical protein n=1 Tax=Rhodopila sp. TaxID=2480087 RepID=UPI002CCE5CA6|nr:hypothetical protein [Rhodopila sp.]HVY14097.1 hypothetical protein [Rhodopila sp.]
MDKTTDAKQTQRGAEYLPFLERFSGPGIRMAVWPIQLWLSWEADVLDTAVPATTEWLVRRREGSKATYEALQRLCACKDANDAAKIQADWLQEETTRLEADFRSLSNAVLSWSQAAARTGHQAMQVEKEALSNLATQ